MGEKPDKVNYHPFNIDSVIIVCYQMFAREPPFPNQDTLSARGNIPVGIAHHITYGKRFLVQGSRSMG